MLKITCVLIFCAVAGGLAAVPNPVATRQFAHAVKLEQTAETSANASLGDLDGDGDLDLVLAKGRHWPLHDRVLLNNGKGEFTVVRNLGETPGRTYSARLAVLYSSSAPARIAWRESDRKILRAMEMESPRIRSNPTIPSSAVIKRKRLCTGSMGAP